MMSVYDQRGKFDVDLLENRIVEIERWWWFESKVNLQESCIIDGTKYRGMEIMIEKNRICGY